MNSIKATARKAGVLYLLLAIIAPFNLMYVPRAFIVPGDATATAGNIVARELTYRFGIFTGLLSSIIFLFLVLSLYHLLKDVDRKHARLMVILVAVSATVGVVNLLNQLAPLILLSGGDFLSVFTEAQLDALALGFLKLRSDVTQVDMAFWGLWLFPFGILVMKSGFFPRVLGILLMAAGSAYLISCFTSIVLPAYTRVVSLIMTPIYLGEVPMVFWLLIKGANIPLREAPRTQAS